MEFKIEKDGLLWIKRGKEWRIQTCPFRDWGEKSSSKTMTPGSKELWKNFKNILLKTLQIIIGYKIYCGEWCPFFGQVEKEEHKYSFWLKCNVEGGYSIETTYTLQICGDRILKMIYENTDNIEVPVIVNDESCGGCKIFEACEERALNRKNRKKDKDDVN